MSKSRFYFPGSTHDSDGIESRKVGSWRTYHEGVSRGEPYPSPFTWTAGTCSPEHSLKKKLKFLWGGSKNRFEVDESYRKVKIHMGHILWPPCNKIKIRKIYFQNFWKSFLNDSCLQKEILINYSEINNNYRPTCQHLGM